LFFYEGWGWYTITHCVEYLPRAAPASLLARRDVQRIDPHVHRSTKGCCPRTQHPGGPNRWASCGACSSGRSPARRCELRAASGGEPRIWLLLSTCEAGALVASPSVASPLSRPALPVAVHHVSRNPGGGPTATNPACLGRWRPPTASHSAATC
jgi:hypothetical protein